jgi:hypothetical protein
MDPRRLQTGALSLSFIAADLPGSRILAPAGGRVSPSPLSVQRGGIEDLPRPSPSGPIVILTRESNGLGDLHFGMKVASHLKSKYAQRQVVFVTDTDRKRRELVAGDYDVPAMTPSEFVSKYSGQRPALIVEAPTQWGTSKKDACVSLGVDDAPLAHIGEYDWGVSLRGQGKVVEEGGRAATTSGLGRDALGVIISEDLKVQARELRELRETFFASLSQADVAGMTIGSGQVHPLRSWWQRTGFRGKLYHGYQQRPHNRERFVYTVLAKEKGGTDPVNIVIGPVSVRSEIVNHFAFGRVVRHVYQTDTEEKVMEGAGRELHLIDVGTVPHASFVGFALASDALWASTGDQSWSEGTTLGKVQQYELIPHKKRFYDELRKVVEKVSGPGKGLARFLELSDSMVGTQPVDWAQDAVVEGLKSTEEILPALEELGALLRTGALEKEAVEVSLLIERDHNLLTALGQWLDPHLGAEKMTA